MAYLMRVSREHKISFSKDRNAVFGFRLLEKLTSQDWVKLGSRQLARGNKKWAITRFKRAIEAEESNVRAYMGLAKAQYYFGLSRDAELTCRSAFSINDAIKAGKLPKHSKDLVSDEGLAETRIIHGKACHDLGEYFGATISFGKALEARPRHPEALEGMAHALYGLDKNDLACALYIEAAAREYLARGWNSRMSGEYKQAIEDLTSSIKCKPTADAYAERGLAKEMRGDDAGARSDYEAALRLDPKNEIARNGIAGLETVAQALRACPLVAAGI